ncbi:MAG: DUF938 domain-containing protein [Gammaproteobacteria bacterium]
MKPFSESCKQNQQPIGDVLTIELHEKTDLLEIGSGTGQHAVYFSPMFPDMRWQTSDVSENHQGIQQWLDEYSLPNTLQPISLNVSSDDWPDHQYDAIYSANTAHIMSWHEVEKMFSGMSTCLKQGGVFCLYGPFNYLGQYTSKSNEQFDGWLKSRDALSGIRHFEEINSLAEITGLALKNDYAMPANNRFLIWVKR